jgi:acyl dehydratase
MTTPLVPTSLVELRELVGTSLGPTEWHSLEQPDVDAFADVTRDHQWIHVDPARAGSSAFGGTVAHGLLTLALCPWLGEQLLAFSGFAHTLNYGYDKIRFPAPTPVGGRVRLHLSIDEVRDTAPGSALVRFGQSVELEGGGKPVCVASFLVWFTEHPANHPA